MSDVKTTHGQTQVTYIQTQPLQTQTSYKHSPQRSGTEIKITKELFIPFLKR